LNIAQDPGAYLYTAPPPWENALTHTAVHNTLMIDGIEQMRRSGRFLYLDWAQADVSAYERDRDGSWQRLTARHNGYHRHGITHQRTVTIDSQQGWVISDMVTGHADNRTHQARLHWLLPDWEFKTQEHEHGDGITIHFKSPHGWLSLKLDWINPPAQIPPDALEWGLARAGHLLAGIGPVHPTWGWTSPTYGDKIPALSFYFTVSARLPIQIQSQWGFP
jgi:hypothetical protein